MTQPMSPREVFDALVEGVADGRWEELPRLYAEQTEVVHPFDPFRGPPLCTREELGEHFRQGAASAQTLTLRPANVTIHETADPEVIIAEFEYQSHGTKPFAVPCVFVLRVRHGKIVNSRDYIDHLAYARAQGQLNELLAALGKV